MPEKVTIFSESAPAPIGPYAQGVKYDKMIYVSGQIPADPATGKLVGRTAAEQTDRVLKNIMAVLQSTGAQMSNIVKTTMFLVDLNDFKEVNEVYKNYFEFMPPARSTVQVSALPLGARVEIEAIAFLNPVEIKGGMML
ncbi:MAG: RidA family protein [bacterium]